MGDGGESGIHRHRCGCRSPVAPAGRRRGPGLGHRSHGRADLGEAERRLAEHGPNELVEEPPKPAWRLLLEQFANTMIVVLIVAAGVTLAIGDLRDTIVILVIVVLNAVIGFVQEYRADRAMTALKGMTAPSARVTRDSVTA